VDTLICPLKGHKSSIVHVEIPEFSSEIITADSLGVVKVWDIRNFQCVQTLNDKLLDTHYEDRVTNMAYCNSNPNFFLSTLRGLHVYDVDKPADPHLSDEVPSLIVLMNTSSLTFLTAGGRKVKIWDAKTGCLLRIHTGIGKTEITAACLDASFRRFIVGDQSGGIYVHNYSNGSLMKTLAKHSNEITALHYVHAEKALISASLDGFVKIHSDSLESDKGQILRMLHMDSVNKRIGQWKPTRKVKPATEQVQLQSIRPGAPKEKNFRRQSQSSAENLKRLSKRRASTDPMDEIKPMESTAPPKTEAQKKWGNLAAVHKLQNQPTSGIVKVMHNFVQKQIEDAGRVITDFDITVMAVCDELGIIATAGPSQAVCMWDYQTCRFISVSFGHNDVITSLEFMFPLLGLLSMDEEGWMHCWRVRPSNHAGQPWFKLNLAQCLKIEVRSRSGSIDALTLMKWWSLERKTVTADEAGRIHVWRLKNADYISMFEKEKERNAVHVHAPRHDALVHSSREDGFVMDIVKTWKAHKDRICEMRLVEELVFHTSSTKEPIIVTSSFDCHTFIWTMRGDCLGSFKQGVVTNAPIDKGNRWKLDVDTEMDYKRQMDEAEHVLVSIRDAEENLERNEEVVKQPFHHHHARRNLLETLHFAGQKPSVKDLRHFLSSVMQKKADSHSGEDNQSIDSAEVVIRKDSIGETCE
jgi:WD40 repeat protein